MMRRILATAALVGCLALAGCAAGGTSTGTSSDAAQQTGSTGTMDGTGMSSSTDAAADAYQLVEPAEAKELIDAGKVVLVDVRTPAEFADGHISGAINIPLDTIGTSQPADLPDLSQPVLVYCRTGVRSRQASDQLVALGYRKVYDLAGGITAWNFGTVR